ncbi:MAG: protoporphyrinogen oxidase [Candidatus Heimdallarchaeota archaeon]|nr:protoporphyrinogen oxidase [Candidatus Heimdallarchaeota archaeon]
MLFQKEPLVAIVGGGIAGLAAAWFLQHARISYVLLEENDYLGGLIQTSYVDGMTIEFGADGFITRKTEASDLVKQLGLQEELITLNETDERIYILSDGKLHPLPEGLQLLVPTRIWPFIKSKLLSRKGKFSVLLDIFAKSKVSADDESLASFVRRKFGDEMLKKLAEPLLAGVYNADSEKLIILATFPQYRELKEENGSLIRGMRSKTKNKKLEFNAKSQLISFKGGMSTLIDGLREKLDGNIILNASVVQIQNNGDYMKVKTSSGDECF